MGTEAIISAFLKLAALRSEDLRPGTPIAPDMATLQRNIRPGDVLLTKATEPAKPWASRIVEWWTGSRWSHAGVAKDKKHLLHSYQDIKRWKFSGDSKVREHAISSLPKMNRDILVLRPQLPLDVRRRAVAIAKEMRGTPYSSADVLRAAFVREKGSRKEKIPEAVSCTAVPGFAYPALSFGGGVKRTQIRPADLFKHRLLKPIMAYSKEGVQ